MQRCFPVSVDDPSQANDASDVPDELQGQNAMIVRRFEQTRAKRKQEEDVLDAEMAKTDRTGWWKRTDWPAHFEKSNLQDEKMLVQVAEMVNKVIEQCVKGLASLPLELRRWLKSVKMKEVDQHPMGRLQNTSSQDRYAMYWKRLICYALRVVQSEPAPDVANPPGRPEPRHDGGCPPSLPVEGGTERERPTAAATFGRSRSGQRYRSAAWTQRNIHLPEALS